ncbi:glucose-6-phosphate isomerase [Minwuia sp.]|uniref:glucose-6-phosphate isomerase n=1 Tax=Minwuia sp. TaxID=2493630 RepID=UPI003A938893
MDLTESWDAVAAEAERLKPVHLRTLRERDPGRFRLLAFHLDDLTLDFSNEKLDAAALRSLLTLARSANIEARRAALFEGQAVNVTEGRAALHMALRDGASAPAGDDVAGARDRFLDHAERVRSGPVTDVVNIGIGGSDLGPAMAAQALMPDVDGPRLHFVANVDGAAFADCVRDLRPETTLVLVASKTFTTQETMANAELARRWLGDGATARMAAISGNIAGCAAFGIPPERVFGFWDWVGGRYSVWSAIGLSLAIGVGAEKFRAFLSGAAAMDNHFRTAPLEANLPVLFALIGVWRRNAMGWPATALVPYDQRLARFPAYIQQLEMESNGKRMGADGHPVARATAPVVWGEPGSNAQHSFFQFLHQGTDVVPVDFIVSARPRGTDAAHHDLLLANCLAQAEALAVGRTADEVRAQYIDPALVPHRTFPGDRPSTLILHRMLTPYALGRLIALYEHKTFVQSVLWGTNAFDQWGVELGKSLAQVKLAQLKDAEAGGGLSDADDLMARLTRLRG